MLVIFQELIQDIMLSNLSRTKVIRVEYNGKVYDFSRGEFEITPRDVVGRIIGIRKGVSN